MIKMTFRKLKMRNKQRRKSLLLLLSPRKLTLHLQSMLAMVTLLTLLPPVWKTTSTHLLKRKPNKVMERTPPLQSSQPPHLLKRKPNKVMEQTPPLQSPQPPPPHRHRVLPALKDQTPSTHNQHPPPQQLSLQLQLHCNRSLSPRAMRPQTAPHS